MKQDIQRPLATEDSSDSVVLDTVFLAEQAKAAVLTFFTPLLGIYAAATGSHLALRRNGRSTRKARRAAS